MATRSRHRLTYQAALMNGVVDGGSADLDDRKGKDLVGRVYAEPFKLNTSSALKGLGFGVAASFGEELGSGTVTGLPAFRTAGSQTFFRYRVDSTVAGTAFSDGNRARAHRPRAIGTTSRLASWRSCPRRVRTFASARTFRS